MTFRRRTLAVILAALLFASPALASAGSVLAPGRLLLLAQEALIQVAAWLAGGPGALYAKEAAPAAQESEGAGDSEGPVWDPDGVNSRRN